MEGIEAMNATFMTDMRDARRAARIGSLFFFWGEKTPSMAFTRMKNVPRSDLLWIFCRLSLTRHNTPARGFFNSLSPPYRHNGYNIVALVILLVLNALCNS
jgi:hypothetical protein